MSAPHRPISTYRLQLHAGFRFSDARRLVPYLHRLGISHVYASPVLPARAGSLHGYDVSRADILNPELGSLTDLRRLVRELRRRSMGLVLDIVPNHMAASWENPWWRDLLENGRRSAHADFFDVDWDRPGLKDRVLLPVLGRPLREALESGEIRLATGGDRVWVRYFEHRFPLAPASLALLLGPPRSASGALPPGPAERRWEALARAAARLRSRAPGAARAAPALRRAAIGVRARLREALAHPGCRRRLRSRLDQAGRPPGRALRRLLDAQHYRLAHWRRAALEVNYRRFFNITELAALRVEERRVFVARHRLLLELAGRGLLDGVRVDHVDGLHDPRSYLKRLRRSLPRGTWLIIEKILEADERIPGDWPVDGTTGYEFLNDCGAVLVDPSAGPVLSRVHAAFTGSSRPFGSVAREAKRQIVERHFGGEAAALGRQLATLAAGRPEGRGIPEPALRHALVEVTACLPVYRTYGVTWPVAAADRRALEAAFAAARTRSRGPSAAAMAFLRRVLLGGGWRRGTAARRAFVQRWQQFTGPVAAKGVEDTALYRYHRLASLNEVGGDPGRVGMTAAEFHARMAERAALRPQTMNTTATHDMKRGEDVRARIHPLSEVPDEWGRRLRRWHRWNRGAARRVGGIRVPDPEEEMLIYQTLIGCWPEAGHDPATLLRRLRGYLRKAAREAKVHTSWLAPRPDHEEALLGFLGHLLGRGGIRFARDLEEFRGRLARAGVWNGLAQVVLKVAAPGVPDFYQGTELWDLRLVDPDNRRAVDFRARKALLRELEGRHRRNADGLRHALLAAPEHRRLKLYVTWRALQARRRRPELFDGGSYLPLPARGARRRHLIGFARRRGGEWAVAVAPRLTLSLPGDTPWGAVTWERTVLPLPPAAPSEWRDAIGGGVISTVRRRGAPPSLPVAAVLERMPVALLLGEAR